ncbi:MAG: ion transporter [Oscillospiraceae bacterium]|jgi:voltage-gated potassium channel|nr:ion transporter [Oscillospiraceae bacterium]
MMKLKKRVFEIIQTAKEGDRASEAFDIFIVTLIAINVVLVVADTFAMPESAREILSIVETISVVIFTIEYILRLWTSDLLFANIGKAKARIKYTFSFMALIDLFAILPFYIPFIIPLDLRVLRVLRIVRILRLFKVNRYINALSTIGSVFKKKSSQLLSSMFVVALLMIITSVLMYNVENAAQPDKFQNAFSSLWWSIATLTTVGYGDIYPITVAGKIFSGIIAFLGIGLVAVPTSIISAGFIEQIEERKKEETQDEKCFCPYCGHKLEK